MCALKSKSVSEMHFPVIRGSKFQKVSPWCPTEGANIKETQSLEENGCREKCLDKSLLSNGSIFSFFIKTNILQGLFGKLLLICDIVVVGMAAVGNKLKMRCAKLPVRNCRKFRQTNPRELAVAHCILVISWKWRGDLFIFMLSKWM